MALTQTQVSQLYVSIFGRASEGEGNTFWQQSLSTMAEVADAMLDTEDATEYFGTSLESNQAFIEHIYLNSLNKTYAQDIEGVDYWVSRLVEGESRGTVVASLVSVVDYYSTSEDPITLAAYNQFTNRVAVSNYMADTLSKAPTNYATSTRFVSEGLTGLVVTSDVSTLDLAKEQVDIIVIEVNTPPVLFAITPVTFVENITVFADTVIATAVATDIDGDSFNYSIISGNESRLFAINQVTGAISLVSNFTPDYETAPTSYILEIGVSDEIESSETTNLVINIGDEPADITAPTVTVITAIISNTENVIVESTETGTAYLVNTSIAVSDLVFITSAADASWNKVSIASANTPTSISAAGLSSGIYKVYATDEVDNLSEVSVNSVTIFQTPRPADTSAPTATVTTATIENTGDAIVQSTETGTAYLVNTSVTVSNVASITSAADASWNQVTIASANTATTLSAAGLSSGTYKVYSTDSAGNFSVASTNSVTIPALDITAPTATVTTATIANTENTTIQSTEVGTAYLVNTSITVSNVASITSAADASWNEVAIVAANTPTTLSATGLSIGTYKVYTTDASGNLSAASKGIVTIPTFAFTMATDLFAGGAGNDIFSGTYIQGDTGTFLGTADTVNGNGGTDTLSLTAGAEAITLADDNWMGISNVEKVVIFSTGAGVQTLTTGDEFIAAFETLGIDLTMTSTLGAINLNMSTFEGDATITTHAIGAGAQTITTGSGVSTVAATNDAAEAQTINGAGLTTVNATITGAGAQTIGDDSGNGAALVSVNATITGAGSQTITSTSDNDVTVVAIAAAGAQTITTAGGDDSITLTTAAGQATTISTGSGNDIIVVSLGTDTITGGGEVDTFVFGNNGSVMGILMDVITDFNTAAAGDILTFGADTVLLMADDINAAVATSNVQQSAGGLITFHTDDNSLAAKIIAIQADTELDAAGSVAMFVDEGNTYFYYAGQAIGNTDDQLIQLSGITTLITITHGATTSIA